MEGGEIMSNSLNKTLYINDIALSDYNIYCSSDTYLNAPQIDYTEYQIPARTGTLIQYNKRLNNVVRNFSCICRKDDAKDAIDELKKLLYMNTGYVKLASDYEPNFYQYGYFAEDLQIQYIINEDVAIFDLIFSCNPKKFIDTINNYFLSKSYLREVNVVNAYSDYRLKKMIDSQYNIYGYNRYSFFTRKSLGSINPNTNFQISSIYYKGNRNNEQRTLDCSNGILCFKDSNGNNIKYYYFDSIPFTVTSPAFESNAYIYTPFNFELLENAGILNRTLRIYINEDNVLVGDFADIPIELFDDVYKLRMDMSISNLSKPAYIADFSYSENAGYFFSNKFIICFDYVSFANDDEFKNSIAGLIENDSSNELHLYFDIEQQFAYASTLPESDIKIPFNKYITIYKLPMNKALNYKSLIFASYDGFVILDEDYLKINTESIEIYYQGWKL